LFANSWFGGGCELQVYDISSSTNPVYVAGRDISGSTNGTGFKKTTSLAISGNHLFVGSYSNTTACSQTAGSAIGCEIQVYDISDPTNPIYVAGRDVAGSSNGTGGSNVQSPITHGNYLFVGKDFNSTPCSQFIGEALGCELQVYDISSSTNPIYVAGRDGDGSADGVTNPYINTLAIKDNYLFVSDCSIQVYDISNPENPLYVKGLKDGISTSLVFKDNYLFAGSWGNSTPCSSLGCELQVYSFATFLNHSTSFTISQTINEEISLSLINPITLSTLPGLSGGTTVASTTFNIKTNSNQPHHSLHPPRTLWWHHRSLHHLQHQNQ